MQGGFGRQMPGCFGRSKSARLLGVGSPLELHRVACVSLDGHSVQTVNGWNQCQPLLLLSLWKTCCKEPVEAREPQQGLSETEPPQKRMKQ